MRWSRRYLGVPTTATFCNIKGSYGLVAEGPLLPGLSPFPPPIEFSCELRPQALNFAWGPRADGTFLKVPLQQLVLQGSVARIPFVTGNEAIYFCCFRLWLI
jgi:hypothetical protein